MSRTFLVCENEGHAEVVDEVIAARLRDTDGTVCNGWSGVYSDGTRYGVLWASPVSELFGVPEDFPELELVEDEADEWEPVPPPEPEPSP